MMVSSSCLLPDCRGTAAAELALSLPILLILMFGSFELGNYFLSEHVVQKSVRDASRYAARLPLVNYPTCPGSPTLSAELQIQRLARTGDPAGTTARLAGWTSDTMTTVNITCPAGTFANAGIYSGFPNGAPVVTVSATVPYNTLFGAAGIGPATLNLNAQSQAAVTGA